MPDSRAKILDETCSYLVQWWRDEARPEEARASFRLLQGRHPDLEMELVWEEESYSQAVHYDALLCLPGEGIVALSFCPERAVPWPLRRAHSARENQVVRVNGQVLEVEGAMACLDFLWDNPGLIASLINLCLIEEALDKRAIEISDAELQQAVNTFRQQQRLFTVAETQRWMEERGLSHERLEQLAAAPLRADKLRDQVTDGRVEEYFEQHRAAFDTAHIASFKVAEEAQARHICEQIRAGVMDFFAAAQRNFLAGEAADNRELFAVVRRGQLSAQQAATIFDAAVGAVIGPVPSGDGYEIVRILQSQRAQLDEPTRAAIKELLFDAWLAERRREATIEWFWGDVR